MPMWSRDGKHLFFVSDGPKLMDAVIRPSTAFEFASPTMLFERTFVGWLPNEGRTYGVSRDGRVLMLREAGRGDAPPPIVVVLNWMEELKQRVPVK